MTVTFRAELMPGRDREARTARVKEFFPVGECCCTKLRVSTRRKNLTRLQLSPSSSRWHLSLYVG